MGGGGCRGGAKVQGELLTLFLGRLKSRTSKQLTRLSAHNFANSDPS